MSHGIGTLATSVGCVAGGPDCLAAINTALAALAGTGGQLVFPAGAFAVSAAITDPGNVTVRCLRGASFTGVGAASINAIAIYDVATGPGTATQVLTSGGPGAAPTWGAVVGAINGYSAGAGSTPPALPAAASYTVTGSMTLYDVATGQAKAIRAGMFTDAGSAGATALKASGALGVNAIWAVDLTARYSPLYNRPYPEMGVCVSTGLTAADTAYGMCLFSNSGAPGLHAETMNPGAGRVTVANEASGLNIASVSNFAGGPVYLRLLSDGTNLHYQTSLDGYTWIDWLTEAGHAGLGYYGFCQGDFFSGSSGYSQMMVYQNQLTTPASWAVAGATNTNPVIMQTATPHTLQDGDLVAIHGCTGNTAPNTGTGSNLFTGSIFVHVTDATHFTLPQIAGNGAYVNGGTVVLTSR